MHLLYKVCRAENPAQLSRDFLVQDDPETRSFEEVQADALNEMKSFLAETDDVNSQSKDVSGATQLWKAAEQGHELAVRAILQHPKTDPNIPRSETTTTPLCVAAFHGHVEVVREILRHPAGISPYCCFFSPKRSMLASPLFFVLNFVRSSCERWADQNRAVTFVHGCTRWPRRSRARAFRSEGD
jgi:ankyrin repeat protein